MKIDVTEDHGIRLREVFSGVLLETSEGNQIGVCMRDDTLEINILPGGEDTGNWWRADMQAGTVVALPRADDAPTDNTPTPEAAGR